MTMVVCVLRTTCPFRAVHQTWCQSIAEGRNYASDGYSHLLDFTVDAVRMGENGSELQLPAGGKTVTVKITAAAMLGEVRALQHEQLLLAPGIFSLTYVLRLQDADDIIANTPYEEKPYWHIERARVKGTRKVPLEIIVNGTSICAQCTHPDILSSADMSFHALVTESGAKETHRNTQQIEVEIIKT